MTANAEGGGQAPQGRKPTMAEIVERSLAFETLSIHVASPGGPHAIIAFDPRGRAEWAALVRRCLPHMGEREALARLVDDEIRSERMRQAINAIHRFDEPPEDDFDDEFDDDERFFAPQPARLWAARLAKLDPNSIGNPSIQGAAACLHLELDGDALPNPQSPAAGKIKRPPIVDMMAGVMRPPVFEALEAARALAGFLEPMLGKARVAPAPGWPLGTRGSVLSSHGASRCAVDLSALRKDPRFEGALRSAIDQAILMAEIPSPPRSASTPASASSMPRL